MQVNPTNLLPVSKEEWVHWKGNKVTQRLIHGLALKRAGMLEDWADGKCSNVEAEKVVQGYVQSLKDTIEYILRDFDFIEQGEEVTKNA